jgi:hypothetical protein
MMPLLFGDNAAFTKKTLARNAQAGFPNDDE